MEHEDHIPEELPIAFLRLENELGFCNAVPGNVKKR
jgi:hypothetical protein